MVKKLWGISAMLVLLLGVAVAPARAQGLDLEAYGGAYIPATDLVNDAGVVIKQKTAAAIGARATLWLPVLLGVEGVFNYAFSDAEVSGAPVDSWVYQASLRANFKLGLPFVSLLLGGGPAYIVRKDNGLYENTSTWGGVVDAGARINLPMLIKIRVDVEDYIYNYKPADTANSKLQNDIMISAGLVFGFGLL